MLRLRAEAALSITLHIKNALARPLKTGSVLPSSERLARRMVSAAEIEGARVIVEFGPGTGIITGEIAGRMSPSAKLVAMEVNPDFATRIRSRFPGAHVFNGCASETAGRLREIGVGGCDRIVSGLPWAVFSSELQQKILSAAACALRPGGVFVSFAYTPVHTLPSGRNFRRNLEAAFGEVRTTPVEWRNMPPAFVYRAVKKAA